MINLADKVKDIVTGFTGIVTSRHEYLNGCARLNVQPKINKDGTLPKSATFDEPQLEIKKRGYVKIGPKDIGGPEKEMPDLR